MENYIKGSQGWKKTSSVLVLIIMIIVIVFVYKRLFFLDFFKTQALMDRYKDFPWMLEAYTAMAKEITLDLLVEIQGGFIAVIIYPFFRKIPGCVSKFFVLCVFVIISGCGCLALSFGSFSDGSANFINDWFFNFSRSLVFEIYAGLALIWLIDVFLVQWNEGVDDFISQLENY
jgi:hypothetical protein